MNQKTFIQKILKLFGLDNEKTMNVSICENVEKVKKGTGAMLENKRLYQTMVGNLLYLSNGSRPEIACAVRRLASKMSQPTKRSLTQAKGVLRCFKNSQNLGGFNFKGKGAMDFMVNGFSDASFPTGSRGKNVDGYIVYVNGMPV